MDGKGISVIVPVYNAELHLEKTIKSLINQTFKEIEIILVNDGSKDHSGKICEEYAKQDARILVVNKENGGLADARNAGLEMASRKYVMFLDADDLFELDSCEHMYAIIEENKADYVIGNYQMMDEDGKKWKSPAFDTIKYEDFSLDKHDYQKSFFVMNSTAWNKIYRRQFLQENDITFKVPSPSEDDYFTSLCYMKAKVGFYTSKVMYLYRNTPNSLSKDCSLSYFKGINYAYQRIFESYQENHELNYYRYVYAKKNAYLLCQLIDSEQVSLAEKIECLKQLEWYFDLREKLEISTVHTSLAEIMQWIQQKDYEKVVLEIERLKEYRKTLPEQVRKRMSFPTRENYGQMEEHKEKFEKQGEEVCFK